MNLHQFFLPNTIHLNINKINRSRSRTYRRHRVFPSLCYKNTKSTKLRTALWSRPMVGDHSRYRHWAYSERLKPQTPKTSTLIPETGIYTVDQIPVFDLIHENRLLVTFDTQLVFTLEHPVSACVRVDRPALMDALRRRTFQAKNPTKSVCAPANVDVCPRNLLNTILFMKKSNYMFPTE